MSGINLMNDVVLGYSRFTSKKGQECLICKVLVKVSDYKANFGHVGYEVEEIFIPNSLFGKFDESVIGKHIVLEYDGRGRYANIIDVSFS